MSINLFNKNYLQIEKELDDKILNINGVEKIDNFGMIQNEKNKELFFKKYIQITNNNENEEEKEKFAIIQKDLLIKPNINQVINGTTSLGLNHYYYNQYGYFNNIDFLKNLIINNKKYFYFYFYNKNNNILKKIILPNNIDFSKWFLNITYIESENETRFNAAISTGSSSYEKYTYGIYFNNKLNSAFLSISLAIKDTKYKKSFSNDNIFDIAFQIPDAGGDSYNPSDTYPYAILKTPLMFKIWTDEDNPIHICQKIDKTITDHSTKKKFYLNKNRNALFINNNSFVDENNDWNLNTNGYFQAYIVQ